MAEIYIYGKVKRNTDLFRVLATKNNIYSLEQVPEEAIEYDPNTLIEQEQFYKLSNFSGSQYASNFIREEVESVNFDQITKENLKKLSYICTVQENFFFFQAISASFYISKKWFSINELTIEKEKPIITINDNADVIYDNLTDILYFKKLSTANRIFRGLDQLYREATAEESQEFLNSDFLDVVRSFTVERISIPNRKKIALIKDILNRYDEVEKQAIYDYTQEYGQVSYEDGKFKIESDTDLKHVLWGIEQRYYTTPIGGEKRVANSVIAIEA
ncbi:MULTISPECIES: hypothetical protein [unclassified Myroides]|uniref:hypothetical protein n=1 Tax=unclassified Myroides TaxID=2642485 RepID=UPI003101231D